MNLPKIDVIIDGNEESQIVAIGDSGALIGTVCLAHKKKRSACITNLYVGESSRGRGVGRKLVEACCDIATESGCETIGLSLCKGNEQSEFYRKLGFRFCYQYENGDSLLAFFLNPVWHGESKGEWQPMVHLLALMEALEIPHPEWWLTKPPEFLAECGKAITAQAKQANPPQEKQP